MSEKFDVFKAALITLCDVHGVILDAGYEFLSVYDHPYRAGGEPEPLGSMCLKDETGHWELNYAGD